MRTGPRLRGASPRILLLIATLGAAVTGCASSHVASLRADAPEDPVESGEENACVEPPRNAALSEELEAVITVYETEGRDAALSRLDTIASSDPDSSYPALLRAQILAQAGQDDEAILVLQAHLCDGPRDVQALRLIARLHWNRSQRGPNIRYERGYVVATPSSEGDVAPDVYAEREARRASETVARLIELIPDDANARIFFGLTLLELGETEAARRSFEECLRIDPMRTSCRTRVAEIQLSLGLNDEAIATLSEILERAPRERAARVLLAQALKNAGRVDEAAAHTELARFWAFIPAFLDVSPSPENRRSVETLASHRGSPDSAAAETIDALLAATEGDSSTLLAAFVFHHSHDELERRAFEGLVSRGEFELIRGLLESGQSACTIREAAGALGAARRVEAFEAVASRLDDDVMPAHPMGIPEALAALHDPRAIPLLIGALGSTPPPDIDSFLAFAYTARRGRAALALASFGEDASADEALRNAVTAGPEFVRLRARASLAIRGDADSLAPVCAELDDDDDGLLGDVREGLEGANLRCD